jgi:hypothetical protein
VIWALRIYIYIYLHFRQNTVLSENFFSQTRDASERFYWPGGNQFAFQMSWSPKRRDSETLATAWTLRLSTCMASKHKKHTYTHSLLLSRHIRFHKILSISVVSVSCHTPALPNTTHYIPFIYKTQNETIKYNFNNTVLLTPCLHVKLFDTKLVTLVYFSELPKFYFYLFI